MKPFYIFVTGGVVSSLGKGITAASLGRLLKARGLKVFSQKLDPYLNFDPGTMSPYQHGEVFVTDDGAEADLDLGHYERFIDENLSKSSTITTGKIYWSVISNERRGQYLGGTVQVIPHITDAIKNFILDAGVQSDADVIISEIGGTVGDIESQPYLEAIRQLRNDLGANRTLFIHVTLLPYLAKSGELKSKPTQHSVKELRGLGIQPDIIILRSEVPVTDGIKDKISLFCNVEKRAVISNLDADSLYEVPLLLEKEGLAELVCEKFGITYDEVDLKEWTEVVERERNVTKEVTVALVGKYVELHDAYLSVAESLHHAGIHNDAKVNIKWIQAADVTDENASELLGDCDAILVPGGFGIRGVDGKIAATKYARENNIPFLGICLGMQVTVIEFARNVLGLKDANSSEFDPETKNPVIDIMPDQKNIVEKGGTMRLGTYPCTLVEGTKVQAAYGVLSADERHRHRYEVNNEYREKMAEAGMIVSGHSPDGLLVEMVELTNHPWFVATQAHPELKSRPNRPHPLFKAFVAAAIEEKK